MFIKENATLSVSNPVLEDVTKPITEALLSDLKIKEVRAIYPLVRAINSGRLTRNYTFYPAEALIGKNKVESPTGYSSFVKPFGKPVIREHQAQNNSGLFSDERADVPMGRIVLSGYKKRQDKKDGPMTLPSKKYIPGTVEGDGSLYMVPAITDPEGIARVLGGAYHTVSIGSKVENVFEAISGKNIAELRRKGEELPPYERGQLYEGKLSYWQMGEIQGIELSFVNVPSDEYAGVIEPDIGVEGIRLLVAEKKSGKSNEFNFFDAKTAEKVDFGLDECIFDESFFTDSVEVGHNIWWLNRETAPITEAANESAPETEVKEPEEETMTVTTALTVHDINATNLKDFIERGQLSPIPDELGLEGLISKLVAGEPIEEFEISDLDLFREVQDIATEYHSTWNEDAAKTAISLFILKEGTIKVPLVENEEENKELTLGELYLYNEDNENYNVGTKLTKKDLEAYPEDSFCGPNQTFPVSTIEQALFALDAIEEYTGEDKEIVLAKIRAISMNFGLGMENEKKCLFPILLEKEKGQFLPLFKIESLEEFKDFTANFSTFAKCYGLTDAQKESFKAVTAENFDDVLKATESLVIKLSHENLTHYVLNSEFKDERTELVMLTGLARKGKITKADLDDAFESYKVFGTSVLRIFLVEALSKPIDSILANNAEALTVDPIESIETISDPVEVTEPVKVGKKGSATRESTDGWLGLRVIPTKKNKNPVNARRKDNV